MATFIVSVIVNTRRFAREKVDATCMYSAFLQMSHKYKPMHRSCVVYKCEYRGKYKYFDQYGKVLAE